MGRPSKLTKERCEFICEGLKKGNYVTTCCRAVGINKSTYHMWRKKGKEGIEPYATFLRKTDEAEAIGEMRALEIIDDSATSGNWLASAWKLERKYPQRFGKKERVDISTDNEFKIEIEARKSPYEMSADEKKLLEEDG